jgi:hypothetical protein
MASQLEGWKGPHWEWSVGSMGCLMHFSALLPLRGDSRGGGRQWSPLGTGIAHLPWSGDGVVWPQGFLCWKCGLSVESH